MMLFNIFQNITHKMSLRIISDLKKNHKLNFTSIPVEQFQTTEL